MTKSPSDGCWRRHVLVIVGFLLDFERRIRPGLHQGLKGLYCDCWGCPKWRALSTNTPQKSRGISVGRLVDPLNHIDTINLAVRPPVMLGRRSERWRQDGRGKLQCPWCPILY